MKSRLPRSTSYGVGYGKPPEHSKFKPGQVNNRRGRPRKPATNAQLFLKVANEVISLGGEGGLETKMSRFEACLLLIKNRALAGNMGAERIFQQFRRHFPSIDAQDSAYIVVIEKPKRA